MTQKLLSLGIALSLLTPLTAAPSLELASPFVDDAVLQREMPLPVWGWAAPGSKVTVAFASQTQTATADELGKWMLKLQPLTASAEERELTVTDTAGGNITRKGLLVGEVWFASGQSNMDWLAGKSLCLDLANTLSKSKEDIPIREYTVDTGSALYPCTRADSELGWKRAKSAGSFSALALAFAAELHAELKVPIGILRSTHGATPIETWTAYEGFAEHPQLQEIAANIRQSNPSTTDSKAALENYFTALNAWQVESEKLIERGGAALPRPKLPGIADDWKGASRKFNKKIAPLIPYAIRGAIWCQGEHNSDNGKIYAAKMDALINGWRKHWARPELPFYFTQMQCYGDADPDSNGFADIREAQTLFFKNAKHVGMVAQHDFNPDPRGIHYTNKLDAGKRLARWALAHEYGKDIAYTGPIYKSSNITGDQVRIQFEQRGPGGGLMVGSKGMQNDIKTPGAYVEPAKETPGAPLQHFRLAGKDRVWHAAQAVIEGNEVVVTSKAVPEPVGVQYAYNASPIGANLYNKAGLPALPFAYFEGKQFFLEDQPAAQAKAEQTKAKNSYLQPSTLLRNQAVLQRDLPVPVWGHADPNSEITVTFGDQKKTTKTNDFDYWQVTLDAMPASAIGRDLTITSSNGLTKTIKDVLIGDVWFMTGAMSLTSSPAPPKNGEALPKALPLVREFRIRAKARISPTPRKQQMEIGSGKYMATWDNVNFDSKETLPSALAYHFATGAQEPGVPLGIVTLGSESPPLTWMSPAAMQTAAGFEKERDELNLVYPNTPACKAAITQYIQTLKQYHANISALLKAGKEIPIDLADRAPAFPQPFYNEWASRTESATHTYNFCISPLTPCAIRGVVWIPGKDNITTDVARYSPSLKAYADGLAVTYGQPKVPFLYAQPTTQLVSGITPPQLANPPSYEINEWPKNLETIATKLGTAARIIK